jgi:hypothetical protein
MNIEWNITESDIERVNTFITQNQNPFVESRISKNVNKQGIIISQNSFLKAMMMCLLTTQQRSGPTSPIAYFLKKKLFPITFETVSQTNSVENFIKEILLQNGLNRYINKIPSFFCSNLEILKNTNWNILKEFETKLIYNATKKLEREVADKISDTFFGFGPKQARNLLQALGLTKYEIPIDSRITGWLSAFGFPVTLSSIPLQDKGYYHFVSDGIQMLCTCANVYPCVLDAVIFSSYDNGQWSADNIAF